MVNIDKVQVFVMGFILLVVGIILFSVLATNISLNNNLDTQTNESVTITKALGGSTGQTAQDDVVTLTNFHNSTDDYTANISTHVNITSAGAITVDNNSIIIGGATAGFNATYTDEGDLYVTDSKSRTIMNLIPIFFVLFILAAAIFVAMEMGIADFLKKK